MINYAEFLGGWIAGTVGLIISHPFETIKVRQQNYNKKIGQTIKQTYSHEGIGGFFKGMLMPLLTIGPYNSIFFGVYCNTVRILQHNKTSNRILYDDPEWHNHVFLAGNVAGFVQVITFCPVEVVKTVLQSNVSLKGSWTSNKKIVVCRGMFECLTKIYHVGGLRMFYRGLWPLLWRDVFTSGAYMLTYEYLFHMPSLQYNNTAKELFAGGVAGFVSWGFVSPFDVVKQHLQADDIYKPIYKGMNDCFRKLYKENGWQIFVKGYYMLVIRGSILNAITFLAFETSMRFLR